MSPIQLQDPAQFLHTPEYFKDPSAAGGFFMDGRCNTAVVAANEKVDETVLEMVALADPKRINEPEVQEFFRKRPLLANPKMADRLVMSLSPIMS